MRSAYRLAGLALVAALGLGCARAAPGAQAPTGATTRAPSEATTRAPTGATVTVYASPSCGCCHRYVPYLRAHGFAVHEVPTDDVEAVKLDLGVPRDVWSCHTATVEGSVVEGHVPVEAIRRLLAERPPVDGIALAGMPAGAPGMGGAKTGPLEVVGFVDGHLEPFMRV